MFVLLINNFFIRIQQGAAEQLARTREMMQSLLFSGAGGFSGLSITQNKGRVFFLYQEQQDHEKLTV